MYVRVRAVRVVSGLSRFLFVDTQHVKIEKRIVPCAPIALRLVRPSRVPARRRKCSLSDPPPSPWSSINMWPYLNKKVTNSNSPVGKPITRKCGFRDQNVTCLQESLWATARRDGVVDQTRSPLPELNEVARILRGSLFRARPASTTPQTFLFVFISPTYHTRTSLSLASPPSPRSPPPAIRF